MTQILEKTKLKLSQLYGEPTIMDNGRSVEIVAYVPQGAGQDDNHLYIIVEMSDIAQDDFGIDSIKSIYSDFDCTELEHDHLDVDGFVMLIDAEYQICDQARAAQAAEYRACQMA